MDLSPSLQPQETSSRFSRYKRIGIIFLVLFVIAGLFLAVRGRRRGVEPLDANLFDSVEQDVGAFSEDASFFDEQEADLQEINAAYETQ